MKNNEKKAYATPKIEVLVVELEQGIAGASPSVGVDNSFAPSTTGGTGWSDNATGEGNDGF